MAAADFIDSVYQDAIYYANQASSYAGTVASATFAPASYDLLLQLTNGAKLDSIDKIESQPNYNPTFTPSASPYLGTPTVTAEVVPSLSADVSNISDFETVVFPDFEAVAPLLNFPDAVSLDDIDAPNNPPELESIGLTDTEYPDLPTLGDLTPIVLPDDVGLTPSVDYDFVETRPIAPENAFAFNEQDYESTLLSTALELVEGDLANGGYGIREEDEIRLVNRAKDRISRASEAELMEADRNVSSKGFTLPSGAHNALAARAAQNKVGQLSEVNNEVYLNRSNLMVQARQFAITTGLNAEQYLMNFHQTTLERSLRVNQLIAEFGLSYFNANVAVYQMGLDAVRVQGEIFRDKLAASKQSLERFFAKLEKAKTTRQLDKDQIDMYQAQFSAIDALTNIHNNKISAARLRKEVQELKLSQYSEQNRWYATQLEAQGQKIQNFRALTEAETVKMEAYRVQAQAHNTVLDGAKIRSDIQRDKIAAQIEKANLQLREYEANITQWEKTYQAALNNAELVMKKHGIDVDKWRESQRLLFSKDELGLRSHDANVKNYINVAQTNYGLIKTAIGANLDFFGNVTSNIAKTADLQSNLATSSYNALNMIAGVIE